MVFIIIGEEGMLVTELFICVVAFDCRSWMGIWGGVTVVIFLGGTGKVIDIGVRVYVGILFICFFVGISCLRMEFDVRKVVFCEVSGLID